MKTLLTASLFVLFSIVQSVSAQESSAALPDTETQAPTKQWTGREILDEVSRRHDQRYEFELKK